MRAVLIGSVLFSVAAMVGAAGFEPATLCSQSRCATRLRYAPCHLTVMISLRFCRRPRKGVRGGWGTQRHRIPRNGVKVPGKVPGLFALCSRQGLACQRDRPDQQRRRRVQLSALVIPLLSPFTWKGAAHTRAITRARWRRVSRRCSCVVMHAVSKAAAARWKFTATARSSTRFLSSGLHSSTTDKSPSHEERLTMPAGWYEAKSGTRASSAGSASARP